MAEIAFITNVSWQTYKWYNLSYIPFRNTLTTTSTQIHTEVVEFLLDSNTTLTIRSSSILLLCVYFCQS